jgi:uncharacterized membrane protein YvbJ
MEVINPTETQTCIRCGNRNNEQAFFCSKCGAPLAGVIMGHISLRRIRQTGTDKNRGLRTVGHIKTQ